MVTPAVTSKRYLRATCAQINQRVRRGNLIYALRVTPSPMTWMSNINNIADAAPAVGDAWPVLIFVRRVRKAAVGVAARYRNTCPARTIEFHFPRP